LLHAGRDLLQDVVRDRRPATALTPLLDKVRSIPSITDDGLTWTIEAGRPRATRVQGAVRGGQVAGDLQAQLAGRNDDERLRPAVGTLARAEPWHPWLAPHSPQVAPPGRKA